MSDKPHAQRPPRFRPLWPETAPPATVVSEFEPDRRYDCIVVGAGITGCSAALHLAEAGAHVCVIESLAPGEGTSGHANGQVMAELTLSPDWIVELYGHDRGEAVIRFTARAPDLVFELIQRHGIACEARRSGWIEGTPYASGMRSMEKRVASWRGHGEPVELLGRDAIRELPVRRLTPVGSSIAVAERSIRFPTIADWRPPRSALALSSMAMWRRADWRRKAAAGGSRRGADRCVRAA